MSITMRSGSPVTTAHASIAESHGSVVGIAELRFRSSPDPRPGGILFVLAHPDDETFLCGGTIARYGEAGVAVHCVCATRGECGTVEASMRGDRSIAEVRTAELANAARVLGVEAVYFLGYRDSGMPGSAGANHPQAFANAPIAECGKAIARLIRALRPRIVVTHGPHGEYGHPDHIRLHEATLLAFRAAGDPSVLPAEGESNPPSWSPDALFVTTFDPRLVRLSAWFLRLARHDPRRFGRRGDVDLVTIADNAPPAICAVDIGRWLATRDRAVRCHRSQLGERRNLLLLPRIARRWLMGTERYARLIPPHRPGEPFHRDLVPASQHGGN